MQGNDRADLAGMASQRVDGTPRRFQDALVQDGSPSRQEEELHGRDGRRRRRQGPAPGLEGRGQAPPTRAAALAARLGQGRGRRTPVAVVACRGRPGGYRGRRDGAAPEPDPVPVLPQGHLRRARRPHAEHLRT